MKRPLGIIAWLAIGALVLTGGKCGGGSGGGGRSEVKIESPDRRCALVTSPFPPGFDFVPGFPARLWVADQALLTLGGPVIHPFDVSEVPPRVVDPPGPFVLGVGTDSDGDGLTEPAQTFGLAPIFDDFIAVSQDLALVTASSYEEVLFFDPDRGRLRSFDVSVPAGVPAADNMFLPTPGSVGSRTGLATFACVRPPPGALDSRGDPLTATLPPAGCDPGMLSYNANFTSGAAVAADRLFVSTSNLGNARGTANTQYLPGSVLVYDLDLTADPPTVSPNAATPVILTEGFNPTHVTAYAVGAREFVLVTVSGAIGIGDEPPTIALTDAAIEVIDAQSLVLVATIPLGAAALSTYGVRINGSGRVGVVGSSLTRQLLAVDLEPLASLPSAVFPPIVLDGSSGADAVIFDADSPFTFPARDDGAPPAKCPGFTAGVAFDGPRLFATESCDGTLAVIELDLQGDPPVPVPADRFALVDVLNITEPIRPDTLGQSRQPGAIEVRPGAGPLDPNVFFLVGEPDGEICGIRVD